MTPKVLLHGVPETSAVWSPLIDIVEAAGAQHGELHTLSLPGFGVPRPNEFQSSMDEYADWLVGELATFGEPVDLVGHDWGGMLTARVASWKPASLRSWVSDAVGALQPGFGWHDLALIWQTEGAGEEFWASMTADRDASAELLSGFGIPLADAAVMTAALDDEMIDSILKLYRSADGIGEQWAITRPIATPGMIIVGDNDPFGDLATSAAIAERIGARFATIPGGSHFWPVQAPATGAALIAEFWAALDD